ncbi:hypothetical protein FPOAC2_05303 [Fusarium poae]|uniref:Uncharacterized protein n=1 Tax=Fusarium poae TaxID=36050 RepID=A0A1B8AUM5_FUSPO|nr:hypothetical protein FPOAC1_005199 [Fusarium poae]KAG8671941.1 hypothetical protein FPOAC1_005199 [Fusarium poae]OBS24160.1 hypothetical protein FPOA_04707 [Fusarium poae]
MSWKSTSIADSYYAFTRLPPKDNIIMSMAYENFERIPTEASREVLRHSDSMPVTLSKPAALTIADERFGNYLYHTLQVTPIDEASECLAHVALATYPNGCVDVVYRTNQAPDGLWATARYYFYGFRQMVAFIPEHVKELSLAAQEQTEGLNERLEEGRKENEVLRKQLDELRGAQ